MDFSQLDTASAAERGAIMYVEHPTTGERTGAWIRLAGVDSKRFRDLVKNRAREQMARKARTEDVDRIERSGLETLAHCTLEWHGITEGGKDLECNEENAAYLYGKYLWLREQVDSFMADRANFLPSASVAGNSGSDKKRGSQSPPKDES
jgi:hypothetical protein